jgi:5-deoxy-5-amino-3-dehydroquinate synthase
VVRVRVAVNLGDRSYDAVVEEGARHEVASLIRHRAPDAQLAVIIAPAQIQSQPWFGIDTSVRSTVLTIPDGEAAKTLSVLESLTTQLSELRLSRRDVLVAVGGGATTDVVGFAAATYLRGVGVIHVATSLVAQVDAAIGGKTAVNLAVGKNLVGAFHQPLGVLCDLETLATLPERERRSGLGEMAKCWLLTGRTARDASSSSFADAVTCAVELKATLVSTDEREGGQRVLLNYGHTLAHALEAEHLAGRPLDLRHGEAVAVGVAFAARLARHLGRVDASYVSDTDAVLAHWHLPSRLPAVADRDELVTAMGRDKKAHHNLTFVLAGADGFGTVDNVAPTDVRAVLEEFGRER